MIVNREGIPISGYLMTDGTVIKDGGYSICVDYENPEDKERAKLVNKYEFLLSKSDYKAIKYSEGLYSEEEYAEIKAERQHYRDEINRLRALIVTPTLTKEEIEEIKVKADENYRRMYGGA